MCDENCPIYLISNFRHLMRYRLTDKNIPTIQDCNQGAKPFSSGKGNFFDQKPMRNIL